MRSKINTSKIHCCQKSILPGLEPGISWSVVRRLIHWATGPLIWAGGNLKPILHCNNFQLFSLTQAGAVLIRPFNKTVHAGWSGSISRTRCIVSIVFAYSLALRSRFSSGLWRFYSIKRGKKLLSYAFHTFSYFFLTFWWCFTLKYDTGHRW